MITVDAALRAHNRLIDLFGGSKGIRDKDLLDSALNRPFATFDNIDLYPTAIEKAVALLESIAINYPFVDGNKRTAYTLMEVILRHGKFIPIATQEEKYNLVIKVCIGEYRFEEIKLWLLANCKPLSTKIK
ncbi:type II toxin-antitoxin system death-on-curing family toxin [Mucilaginibacter lutimaris]|uniref:Type II toxin-antitoxin system death-on-curing family toxin n=1 Tax=Mucilaginibacter lutimaris TaxID=931629 RepID=A0ABW2ZD72_9SPHI